MNLVKGKDLAEKVRMVIPELPKAVKYFTLKVPYDALPSVECEFYITAEETEVNENDN